jgi:hypothetical protein
MYGKINKPFWDDKPVAVIGGGSSLIDFDFEKLRGAHVLAVKGTIFDIPWADAVFGLDFNGCRDKLAAVQSRIYWAVREDQPDPPPAKNITFLKRIDGQDLSDDPGVIYSGGTSGFGALQVCIHKRAKQIVLFGFDYDGNSSVDKKWEHWAAHFSIYVPYLNQHGIQVVNACPASAIRCFQKVALRDGVAICTNGP